MKLTFLGTGTSTGVPSIGCECETCLSEDSRDKRLRVSVLIEHGGQTVLVDTSSDFRQQALRQKINWLDAILITHCHADHIFGLDDVRIFNWRTKQPMPLYGTGETLEVIRRSFSYVFESGQEGGGKPKLDLIPIEIGIPFEVAGLHITPLEVRHGAIAVTAFRVCERPDGPQLVYATDCNAISPETLAQMEGVDLFILDALTKNRHPTHFSLAEAVEVAQRLTPGRTLFTCLLYTSDAADE